MALYQIKDSEYWWVSVVNPRTGQRIRRSTKLTDKSKAKAFEQDLVASMVLGQEHYALAPKEKKRSWRDAAERWLLETGAKKDHLNDQEKVKWLDQYLGDKPLAQISAALIHSVAEVKCREASPATANRYLSLVRAVLNRAHKQWGWLSQVPHIRPYKEPEGRIRYLTQPEARKLLTELPPHLRSMTVFSLNTGLRASNVVQLKWSQVDVQRQHIVIHADEAKGGKPISVPLNSQAFEVIVGLHGTHPEFVFTFRGQPVTRPNNHSWHKALIRAGIKDFRWHDLRHTWATWHLQAGTPLHVLQELGGWSSFEMVRRYAHLTSEHLQSFQGNIGIQPDK